ncbi:sulfatase-like hydrolase/transferase [Aureliella helgolandensis]|uniref:Arylsulfatase n=1 Tax=Aureliella helgolandensis TaxID=2527968 RepID=A0A518G315_9BACT|nr:sulfatase-like hydrolase/transferase [Aureliella helgolandensis]QDV22997.1 Arylsulfatase [Aureliella helgolandensis]
MVNTRLAQLLAISSVFFGLLASAGRAAEPASPERPNIVLIMADDVSWEAFGCYGAEEYATPHLDALAAGGVRFTHCYSTPICTTSRVELMTGKYSFRNYTHFGYLDPQQKTFGHLLKQAGYETAIAGKWQLNGLYNSLPGHEDSNRPVQAGFDQFLLWQLTRGRQESDGGGERFWNPVLEHNGRLLTSQENAGKFGPDLLCDFVCNFIQQPREAAFFVYYPMVLVHDPFVPTPDTIGDADRATANKPKARDKKRNFVAMVNYMDKLVGRIVDELETSGQLENTLLLFTADNGTNRSITSQWQGRSIRGGKGGMTNMGTHVPLIASWKGRTVAGSVVDELVDFTDFYPTLAAAAGVGLDATDPVDGYSFLSSIVGESTVGESSKVRPAVFLHYQPYWNQLPGQFARTQQYKLYRDGRFFDVSRDLEELLPLQQESLEESARDVRQKLQQLLDQAPEVPLGKRGGNSGPRPIHPDWSRLVGE